MGENEEGPVDGGEGGDGAPQPPVAFGPPPGHPSPGAGYPPPGYAPPGYGYGPYGGQQTEGMAIGALVSAIGAFVVCPVIPAIVALVLAAQAQARIDASGGRLTGTGLVTAARVVAVVNLGLAVVVVLVGMVVSSSAGVSGT